MSKQEERSQRVAQWLAHLRAWSQSGKSASAYAAGHGLTASAMYYWRRVLTREGHWHGPGAAAADARVARRALSAPLRFARVAVTQSARPVPLVVRVVLGNGRRAEIDVPELERLSEVLGVLERWA